MKEAGSTASPEWFTPLVVILAGPLFSKFITGTTLAQTALMVPQLDKENSSLTTNQVTWIGSISMLGAAVSMCLSGFFSNTFGRIRSNQICYLFCCTGFALLSTTKSFVPLMFGRFIIGIGNGFGLVSSVHIAEVSPPLYRGLFLSLISVFTCLGHLFVHLFGCYLTWSTTTASLCVISLLGLVLSLPLYESPQWLVQRGNLSLARRSLEQIGCSDVDAALKELEANTAKDAKKKFFLKTMKRPEVWKPLFINIAITIFSAGNCTYLLIVDPVSFIMDFPTAFDPLDFTVVLSLVRLFSLITCVYSMRRLGRRTIGALSGFSTAAVLLGVLICMRFGKIHPDFLQKYNWTFNFAFVLLAITTNMGMFQLPMTLSNEMFPIRVRGLMSLFNLMFIYLTILGVIKFYRELIDVLGLEGLISVFAANALMLAVVSLTILVETHGKTLDEIEQEFRGKEKPNKCKNPLEKS